MKEYYNRTVEETASEFSTDILQGLTSKQAAEKLLEYGPNSIDKGEKRTFLKMFFAQFKSFMILVLMAAAAISGTVGLLEGEGLTDTFVIMGILLINAFVGAYQENKAEESLESLEKMAAPLTKVKRNGNIAEVRSKDLVPGDIVILETGTVAAADMRLIEAVNLKIQESSLTGESVPAVKNTGALKGVMPLGDRGNMAHSTGIVTYGRGKGIVTATGMRTEVGKIAGMLQNASDTKTPMTIRLEQLGKILGISALAICAVIFLVGLLYGNPVMELFMTAVSLAVAAIPEGLPAVSTVVLAIGVQRMVKHNAIIRNLPAVETLGSASVICSDKTGTLTQNKMTVVELYLNNEIIKAERTDAAKSGTESYRTLISSAVLCSDAQASDNGSGGLDLKGDPTETALLSLGINYGFFKNELEKKYPRAGEVPFDSERKRMSTVNRTSEKTYRINLKGGLDETLSVCSRIDINGEIRALTENDRKAIREQNETMAGSALRVLAVAYKDIDNFSPGSETEQIENDMIFAGMLGMIDPARPEVIEAVKKCHTAGIRPVMITGDHKTTALAIAREIGIFREGDLAITGSELENLSDDELYKSVAKYSVYARVAPEHKVRIVKAWQKRGDVVAMTGDGVNDAPALKQADIGAAMGITGTDVAKGTADMVLTDDNFATIVSAVKEGRRIYDNILKAVQFLLSTNTGEIFLILFTSVFNMGTPLLPIHILWVNLVTDSLPALALSVDPAEDGIMARKPINSKKGFMTRGMIWRVLYQGVMIGSLPLIAFILGKRDGGIELGRTMAFATLVFAQLVHVRNIHSPIMSSFKTGLFYNKPLLAAIAASAFLALIILLPPPLREIFSLTEMDARHWIITGSLSLMPIVIVEIFKLFKINDFPDR